MPNVTVYVMTSWQNLPSKNTALEATNLNHIEQGIKNVTDFINSLNATAGVYLCGAPFTQELLTKLNGIEAQANKYVLPIASDQTLGGVKVDGSTIIIDQNGVISGAGGSLETLADVAVFEKEDGQFLKWDSTEGKWINATLEVVTALSALTDVAITTPEDGDVLKYNSTTSKWENGESGEVLDYNETMEVLGVPEPEYDGSIYKKITYIGTGTTSNSITFPTIPSEFCIVGKVDSRGYMSNMSLTIWGSLIALKYWVKTDGTSSGTQVSPLTYNNNVVTLSGSDAGAALNYLNAEYDVYYR